ncbi:MAG: GNAT family N-acetyltransferase [Methanomicrobiales archaeon]|jgi:predicted GNAT family N-acyltransferase|nr:GNAT family N-acetyltransferase [Methanomicrobiales archaeon]
MIPDTGIPFSDLSISLLSSRDQVNSFKCSNDAYTRFLKRDAIDAMNECTGCTHLVYYKDGTLVGYFTLVNDIIFGDKIEEEDIRPGFRYDSYPALKIARLATHKLWENLDIGKFMLVHSISFAIIVNQYSACRFITVDAVNEKVDFYKKFGFVVIEDAITEKTTPMYFNHTAIIKILRDKDKQATFNNQSA